jgi:hypothetical protein
MSENHLETCLYHLVGITEPVFKRLSATYDTHCIIMKTLNYPKFVINKVLPYLTCLRHLLPGLVSSSILVASANLMKFLTSSSFVSLVTRKGNAPPMASCRLLSPLPGFLPLVVFILLGSPACRFPGRLPGSTSG